MENIYLSTVLAGLTFGGLWYVWETAREKERERIRILENLVRNPDFEVIKSLNNRDYQDLLDLLPSDQAESIRERIALEAETRRMIEEERKRSRFREMAQRYNINEIKRLNTFDFEYILQFLSSNQISVVRAMKENYDSELRLKEEIRHLRREQDLDIRREYTRGYNQGQIDGRMNIHARGDVMDWFFTSTEYRQGYELGWQNGNQLRGMCPPAPVYILHTKDTTKDTNTRDIANLREEVKEVRNAVQNAVQNVIKTDDTEVIDTEDPETEEIQRKLDILNMMMS